MKAMALLVSTTPRLSRVLPLAVAADATKRGI
jgi:hypothetical protein